MYTPEEIVTPVISKVKRLDVERLVLDAGSMSDVKTEEEERRKWPFVFSPVQSMRPTAVRMHPADRERCAPPSPVSPWPMDSHASGKVGVSHVQCRRNLHKMALQRQQQQQFPSQSAGNKDRVCGRNLDSSSLTRQASRNRGGKFLRSRSRSRSPSVSLPLPPPPLVMEELPRSQERTRRDFVQISRRVCEEGAALERFLALEVAPVARKVFDAAVAQHSKACRLLDVNHIGGLISLDSEQEDERPSEKSLSRDSFKNDAKNEHAFTTSSTVGQNTSVASSDTVASLNMSSTSTEAWRRAVRAGVINVGSPSALSLRPSLPARKLDAYFAGDACESPRWSIGGRFAGRGKEECGRKEFVETPKAVDEEENEPTEGTRSARVSRYESDDDMAAVLNERRNETCDYLSARQDCAEDSEEEEEDGLFNFSRQVATDIGSKIVGLSSRIRRKAAKASQGLRKF